MAVLSVLLLGVAAVAVAAASSDQNPVSNILRDLGLPELVSVFEEEKIDSIPVLKMLVKMAASSEKNLAELGVSEDAKRRLQRRLQSFGGCTTIPATYTRANGNAVVSGMYEGQELCCDSDDQYLSENAYGAYCYNDSGGECPSSADFCRTLVWVLTQYRAGCIAIAMGTHSGSSGLHCNRNATAG